MNNRRHFLPIVIAGLLLPLSVQAGERPPRAVSVSGEGVVSTIPDRAEVSMAVEQVDAELATAEKAVARSVRDLLTAAGKLGVDSDAIATGAVSLRPEYVWDEDTRRQKMVGYRVRRDIRIELNELELLGGLLQAATRAGITEVSPPVLKSSREKDLQRQALVEATEDAREKAVMLAATLDVALGPVLQLDAARGSAPPPMPMVKTARMAMAESDNGNAEMGLSTGRIEFRASVHARFELTP